jgi:predicted RNase H-like HicB family nuclease
VKIKSLLIRDEDIHMKVLKVGLTFTLPVKTVKRRKWYESSCPIIDVHSQGETEKKAKENLIEALSLFFISCIERGTLDAVLRECGFKPGEYSSRNQNEEYIKVPIPLLAHHAQKTRSECHA